MKWILTILAFWQSLAVMADDSSRLWLRFPDTDNDAVVSITADAGANMRADSAVMLTATDLLKAHWQGEPVALQLVSDPTMGPDAFCIRKLEDDSFSVTATSASGLLYAAYFMLRSQTMGDGCLCQTLPPEHVTIEQPAEAVRSIALSRLTPLRRRSSAFGSAMASIGVNEIVLPLKYATKSGELAEALRPYAIALRFADDGAEPLELSTDDNWTGDRLSQFDWYARGRRLWQPDVTPERLAFEWLAQTFSSNPHFIINMRDALLMPAGTARTEQLIETWQQMQSYIDNECYDEVRNELEMQLGD